MLSNIIRIIEIKNDRNIRVVSGSVERVACGLHQQQVRLEKPHQASALPKAEMLVDYERIPSLLAKSFANLVGSQIGSAVLTALAWQYEQ
jgi:hypothetical protein